MKYRMLDLLSCPECGNVLSSFPFKVIQEDIPEVNRQIIKSPRCNEYCGLNQIHFKDKNSLETNDDFNCYECYQKEIIEGLLTCQCGSLFPIINSIPRFIENKLTSFPEFTVKYNKQLNNIVPIISRDERKFNSMTPIVSQEFERIRSSFNTEWNMFDYNKDKAWGWDLEIRKEQVLNDFGLEKCFFKGKIFLDAGCGCGTLTAFLSDLEMEIVGLDISESIIRADLNKSRFAKDKSCFVHFVQGNLFNPPLVKNSFDFIYSYGVLHHTPNTQETFRKIVPLIKKGGRIYIWVYHRRGLPVRIFGWHGRWFRRHTSLRLLSIYCRMLAPFYKLATDTLSTFRIYKFRKKRKISEISLDLFDAFSPEYNHTHRRGEVCKWFKEENLRNINVSGVQKQGFGVYGDKI